MGAGPSYDMTFGILMASCLLEKFDFRAVYDAGSYVEAKVSSIIRNGDWFWPCAHSDSIVAIQSRLSEVELGVADVPLWTSGMVPILVPKLGIF
jgi:hypothetical protein